MHSIIEEYLGFLLTPLSFLPSGILLYFQFVTGFFKLLIAGKLLRWLWDILPIA